MFAGRKQEKIHFGFMGLSRGAGTTHMAVSTAAYCSSYRGMKTAFIELSGHNDIESLREYEASTPFNIYGVDYYPCVNGDTIYEILNSDYDCTVMDLGSVPEKKTREFAICDRKILLGIFSPWNEKKLFLSLDEILSDKKINYRVSGLIGGSDSIKRDVSRKYNIPVRSLPFIPDAFNIRSADRAFFNEII
ncbi:MAG: hypothetical protein K5929_07605 [Lachnospiraceae bacterium]|nr:hypothetical protein [Lachnospiraceae bacterium]